MTVSSFRVPSGFGLVERIDGTCDFCHRKLGGLATPHTWNSAAEEEEATLHLECAFKVQGSAFEGRRYARIDPHMLLDWHAADGEEAEAGGDVSMDDMVERAAKVLSKRKITDLRAALAGANADTSGKKTALAERLAEATREQAMGATVTEMRSKLKASGMCSKGAKAALQPRMLQALLSDLEVDVRAEDETDLLDGKDVAAAKKTVRGLCKKFKIRQPDESPLADESSDESDATEVASPAAKSAKRKRTTTSSKGSTKSSNKSSNKSSKKHKKQAPSRKAAVESDDEDDGVAISVAQSPEEQAEEEFWAMTVSDLKEELRRNNMRVSGSKAELVDRCVEGKVYGVFPHCPSCFTGMLKSAGPRGGSEACCPGYFDDTDYISCGFLGIVPRKPWTA